MKTKVMEAKKDECINNILFIIDFVQALEMNENMIGKTNESLDKFVWILTNNVYCENISKINTNIIQNSMDEV